MKPHPLPQLQVLILAAGFSTRLGQPKALARIRGISLLQRTARLLAPYSRKPLIVVVPPRAHRYELELRGLKARIIANPARSSGLSESLRRGLAHARWAAATLIVPVDLAELEGADIERLLGRWLSGPRRIVARRIGGSGGVPVILPKAFYRLARQQQGDVGLGPRLQKLALQDRTWIDMPSATRDVDTPQDLQRSRRRR